MRASRAAPILIFGAVLGLALSALALVPAAPMGVELDGPDDISQPESGVLDAGGSDTSFSDGPTCNQNPVYNPSLCADSGTSGCAGYGGQPGTGGQGGGAAIALYIIGDSHVTVSNGAFFVAHGGQGGQGGAGGTPSGGNPGSQGGSVACPSSCTTSCKPTGGFTLEGGAPGTGTSGGGGGSGGGGAGGPIYFYATVDAGAPNIITPSTLDASGVVEGGGPGAGGPPNGQAGLSGVSFP